VCRGRLLNILALPSSCFGGITVSGAGVFFGTGARSRALGRASTPTPCWGRHRRDELGELRCALHHRGCFEIEQVLSASVGDTAVG
jgi:hypothetical protein